MSPRFSVDSTKILSHCAPFCPDLACGTGTAQAGGNRQDRVERDERRSGQRRGIFYPCVPCPSCPFRSVLHRSLSAVPAASPSGSRDSEDLWILLLLLYFFFFRSFSFVCFYHSERTPPGSGGALRLTDECKSRGRKDHYEREVKRSS